MKFKSLLYLGFLTGVFFFGGCTSESSSEVSVNQGSQYDTPAHKELRYNHDLIRLAYLYINDEKHFSQNVEDYYNANLLSDYGYSACYPEYSDVCYMYAQLSDPFTRYYDPNIASQVLASIIETDSYVGTGIVLSEDSGSITVSYVTPQSPAEKVGVLAGDTILSIEETIPANLNSANKLLDGSKGDVVDVKVKRGEQQLTFKITLEEMKEASVILTYKDSIPVIRITQFATTTINEHGTFGEFYDALKMTDGAKATIIDLRDNPGGEGDQCNSVSAEFLGKGDTITIDIQTDIDTQLVNGVKTPVRKLDTIPYVTQRDGIAKDRYVVFLADTGSASCAELMLSAVTSNRNAPIVGLNTYGKGIGQYVIMTQNQGVALITGIQGQDHLGRIYHKLGFAPDYESGDPTEQMAKAVEWAKERTKIREAGFGTEPNSIFFKVQYDDTPQKFPTNRKEFLKQFGGKYIIKN